MFDGRKRWAAIALLVVAVGLPAGVVQARRQSTGAPLDTAKVTIDNFKFSPLSLEIAAGTTVTWTNRDDVPHVVASVTKKLFASKALDTGDVYRFTFEVPGTYEYYCSMHPRMMGKIVVR